MIPSNITREHVVEAIKEIKRSGVPNHRESVRWSLVFDGEQFPPKYVISLANKFASGRELDPHQFSGGYETNSFLRKRGFEIVEKTARAQVGFQAVSRNWWIEKTYYKGRFGRETGESSLGKALWSPQKDRRGADIYKNPPRSS